MSGHIVRQRFVKEFRGLRGNTRAISSLVVASYVTQTVASIAIGFWLLQQPLTPLSGAAVAILMLFIGTRLRGFNNIVHECSHFTFAERREDNVLLGSFCASMVLGCFRDYREEHMTHHQHLGDYDKDMDLQGIRDFRLEDPLTPRTIARHVLTALSGLHLPYYLGVNLSGRDGAGFRALKIGLIAAAVGLLLVDPIAALLMVWLPFVWIYSAINYWTDCIDHGGLVGHDDELHASRNLLVPKAIRVLLFPRNDCYHLIHHLFPQVPAGHLDSCHHRLLSDPNYRARVAGEAGRDDARTGHGNPQPALSN